MCILAGGNVSLGVSFDVYKTYAFSFLFVVHYMNSQLFLLPCLVSATMFPCGDGDRLILPELQAPNQQPFLLQVAFLGAFNIGVETQLIHCSNSSLPLKAIYLSDIVLPVTLFPFFFMILLAFLLCLIL